MASQNNQALTASTTTKFNVPLVVTNFMVDSTISGLELQDYTVVNCTLHRVTLRDCMVTTSKFTDCKVFCTTITDSSLGGTKVCDNSRLLGGVTATNSSLENCMARRSQFVDCNFEATKIYNSEVRQGVATKCELNNCDMIGVTANDSQAMNPSIEDCKLFHSVVSDTKPCVNTSIINCKFTTSPLTLRKFPPEIRALIFELAMNSLGYYSYSYRMPSLAKGLRGDSELYREALEVHSRCSFLLKGHKDTVNGIDRLQSLSETCLRRLRKLSLCLISIPPISNNIITQCQHLRGLRLSHIGAGNIDRMYGLLKTWFKHCNTIQQLDLMFYRADALNQRHREAAINEIVKTVNESLQTKGYLCDVESEGHTRFFWKAHKGNALRWTDPIAPAVAEA